MKLDIILSLILHIGIIVFTVISSPFDHNEKPQFDNVIKVSLKAPPSANKTVALPKPIVPQAIDEPMPEIPIDAPTTLPMASIPEKVKEEPKQKPKKKSKAKTNNITNQSNNNDGNSEANVETSDGEDSPFAGATIDNASFNYPYWFTQAFNKIRRNWRNPISADIPITCTIYFQVIKSGRLVKAEIKKPSGIPAFDNACLRSVENSTPFPPLPRQFVDEIIGITLPMQYQP